MKNILQILPISEYFGKSCVKNIPKRGPFDVKVIENGCMNKLKIKNRRRKFQYNIMENCLLPITFHHTKNLINEKRISISQGVYLSIAHENEIDFFPK